MDDATRSELVFSNKFACPICNYALSELEPRLFSFNSPIGACPTCDGLGTQEFFDPEKIVANLHLSLAGGAVRGWDRRNAYYFQLIQSLARHTKFDIEAPFDSLPAKIRTLVLFGSGEDEIEFKYLDGKGGTLKRKHPFEGIVKNLERRFTETESATVREELAKYRSERPLSRVRRHAPESRGTQCLRRWQERAGGVGPVRRQCHRVLRPAHAHRLARRDCGEDRQGDRRPPGLPGAMSASAISR